MPEPIHHTKRSKTRAPASGRKEQRGATDSDQPEWLDDAWEHRVEAEARNRLKRHIRDVADRERASQRPARN